MDHLSCVSCSVSSRGRCCPDQPSPSASSPVKNNSGVTPAGQCGTWVKEPDGGYFTSPNYPEKYPPERECVYIIEGELLLLSSSAPHVHLLSAGLLQPLLASASTSSSMTTTPSRRPGSASLTTSRSGTAPSASPPSSAATAASRARPTCAPAAATSTSSLWPTGNWRPPGSLRATTSRRVGVARPRPRPTRRLCP